MRIPLVYFAIFRSLLCLIFPRCVSILFFMPETRNSKSSAGSPDAGADKNRSSEFVTTSMLNEMLQLQERMFKTLLDSLLNNFNSRLDAVVESVADIKTRLNICQKDTSEFKTSLEFSQKDIDELKPCKSKLDELEADIDDIYDSIDYHMDKLEYLENQSRRNNIRIDGIEEEENESWDTTVEKVKQVLTEKLNLADAPDIERAHRVGRFVGGSRRRPRTIVCRLRDWRQKNLIIRSARRFKPTGLFVNEDLAKETMEKREEQRPRMEEARRNGKLAYFVLDRLVVKDRPA